jgi:hypothetical protein
MDLNEARKVLWIRPNRRPMGELLDEGLLTKGKLEWAIANAYSSKLQEAAKILLPLLEKTNPHINAENNSFQLELPKLEIPLTIDQAKATIWPFAPYKGEPIGPLVIEKKISLKDLGFAIENAWDSKVRNAALVLSAIRMNQIVKEPQPSKGHVAVVSKGRSFSTRRQFQFVQGQGIILGLALGTGIFMLISRIFWKPSQQSSLALAYAFSSLEGIVALIMVFAILIGTMLLLLFTVDRSIKELDKTVELYRKGEDGEERVADVVKRTLNGEWSLFRNVTIPGQRGGDMDAVLVGPTGVWNLEIKTLSGKFANIGEMWQCLEGKKWKSLKRNPSIQSRKNALRLKNIFEADHVSVYIKPVVVWANPESPVKVENPSVAVWKLDRLEEELGNIQEGKEISGTDREKIYEKLTKLVERQKS